MKIPPSLEQIFHCVVCHSSLSFSTRAVKHPSFSLVAIKNKTSVLKNTAPNATHVSFHSLFRPIYYRTHQFKAKEYSISSPAVRIMSDNTIDVSNKQQPPRIRGQSDVRDSISSTGASAVMSAGTEASANAIDNVDNNDMHVPPPLYAMENIYETAQFGLASLPSRSSSTNMNNSTTNTGQYVNMSDIFTFLRTAESEGRIGPDKCSRLRHVLMGAESSAVNGGCCWMDVVFKVLCELIPAPIYPRANAAMACNDKTHHNGDVPTSSQDEPSQWSTIRGNPLRQSVTNDESSIRDIRNEPSIFNPPSTTVDSGSEGITCQPCKQPEMKPVLNGDGSDRENNDAVAALLDMKMNPSPQNNKRKASSSSLTPSDPPSKTPAAIYPHPFSYIKDPKLYRRTRCKVPNCPNNGGACPDHGHDIKICRINDCTNRAVKSGVCSKHGAKRPLCRVEGCTNQSKREGRCIKHGAVYGNCSEEGCVNLARSGGLCRKHGAK